MNLAVRSISTWLPYFQLTTSSSTRRTPPTRTSWPSSARLSPPPSYQSRVNWNQWTEEHYLCRLKSFLPFKSSYACLGTFYSEGKLQRIDLQALFWLFSFWFQIANRLQLTATNSTTALLTRLPHIWHIVSCVFTATLRTEVKSQCVSWGTARASPTARRSQSGTFKVFLIISYRTGTR